jgi:hypothetical protein
MKRFNGFGFSSLLQQQDTIVYGVEVPGVEGRAGMAAIVEPTDGLDLNSFVSAIQKQLPSYARPLFLRLVARLDITGTFKMKKMAMQKEGFNPNYIKVKIFFRGSNWNLESSTKACPLIEFKIRHRLLSIQIGLEQAPFVFLFLFFLISTCKKPADYGPQQY